MSREPCFLEDREVTSLQADFLQGDRQKLFLITKEYTLKTPVNLLER